MQIGTVIRKYRKEKNMTQEEMASYLGVTAPAVNKWENGNACPDIMLLAPIARLLGISTDTLLSYREELTKQEIANISNEIGKRLMKGLTRMCFEVRCRKYRSIRTVESWRLSWRRFWIVISG